MRTLRELFGFGPEYPPEVNEPDIDGCGFTQEEMEAAPAVDVAELEEDD